MTSPSQYSLPSPIGALIDGQLQVFVADAVAEQPFSVAVSVTVCPDVIPDTVNPEIFPLSVVTVAPAVAVKETL